MYEDDVPTYASWADNVLDETQYYGYDGAVSKKKTPPIEDILELTQYYGYDGPNRGNQVSVTNLNATFQVAPVADLNATFQVLSGEEGKLATVRESLLENMGKQEDLLKEMDNELEQLKTEKKLVKRQAEDVLNRSIGFETGRKQVPRHLFPTEFPMDETDHRRRLSFANLDATLRDVDATVDAANETIQTADETLLAGSMLSNHDSSLYWRRRPGVLVGPNDSAFYKSTTSLDVDDADFYTLGHPDESDFITSQGPYDESDFITSQGPFDESDFITSQGPFDESDFITSQGPFDESDFITSQGPYDFPRQKRWYGAPRRYLENLTRNTRALRSNRVAPYDG